ncbi:HDOD domain-containing protein [Pseudoalteromonas sp.]|uniref:HDOD domain-containing protein n=1 Tax=Pseudoalteromonas sp. TaxID=53249 RepID=UPI0026250702|nr:HDOD domain-containing protein [Pseudoalteromonas sp.]MCP4587185.1 HDOD domain-containing protein [Pseudoalteromonas sp.]
MINLDEQHLVSLERGFHIPPKPELLSQIAEEMQKSDASLDKVANLISRDISLSALLLKTINSPVFGLQRTISDIRQAAMFLGLDQLNRLVTLALLKQNFKGNACISLERFWDESVEVANACVLRGNRYKSLMPVDELYSLGLFHNVGIAAMALKFRDYVEVLKQANLAKELAITDLEQARYQCDHAVIGYFISVSWHLPKPLCHVILNHHNTHFLEQSNDEQQRMAYAILKCAESAVDYARHQQYSSEWFKIKEQCLSELGIVDQDFADMVEDYVDNAMAS